MPQDPSIPPENPLEILCPMHVVVDAQGMVVHMGPTMKKLCKGLDLTDKSYAQVFDVLRPRGALTVQDLLDFHGGVLQLRLRDPFQTRLKGVAVPYKGLVLLNLSFGYSVPQAISRYGLSNGDFAPTDLTIELLYLIEAGTAAMDESRALNARLEGAKSAAEEQAFTDTLTGLKNRRALDQIMDRLLSTREVFSCMHVDLDYFKSINDTLGHAAGDEVLRVVAEILISETRTNDVVARVGGDEFVLLLVGLKEPEILEAIAARIIEKLEVPIPFERELCRISGSAGTSRSTDYRIPVAETLLHHADIALYASKRGGRGQHTLYNEEMLAMDLSQSVGERGAAHPDAEFTQF